MSDDDPMTDFARRKVAVNGVDKTVYVAGTGPAVVVLPEMPGISPDVLRLARWVRDAGFTVHVPSLFGTDGAFPTAEGGREVVRRACVSAEFRAFAGGGTSPVTVWLRGLARQAHTECGGPGVGAIGLCFTGNFALTMALEPAVIAPVVNHPSLPLDDPGGLELNPADARAVRERIDRDGLRVLAYRFEGDRWCTGQRFAAYRALLGDAFDGRVLPDSAANPTPPPFFADVVGTPHSVVTAHLVDEAGHPTLRARDEILAFLTDRLHPREDPPPPATAASAGRSVSRILAASAVIKDDSGRFLLVLRASEPEAGRWSVPGGRVEEGESLQEAAAREVLEETGLAVRVLGELGSLDLAVGDGRVMEIHDFAAVLVSGEVAAADDAADARWFTAEELTALPLTDGLLDYLSRYRLYP